MNKENTKEKTTIEAKEDPFDDPLEDMLILDDIYFEEAREGVTVDGMTYSFLKPPYMLFDDHYKTKLKLKEAYSQREFLLMYGYSGCGKTTVLTQFAEKYPDFIHLISDFTSLSPAQMIVKMGDCVGLPLKQRSSEVFALQERLRSMHGVMLFLLA